MTKEQMTTAADFPGLTIYREARPTGPVYSIEFSNKEHPGYGASYLWVAVSTVAFIISIYDPERYAMLVFYVSMPAMALCIISMFPRRFRRVIEMDFGAREMRVKRNGREQIRKPLPRFELNTTLEHHELAHNPKAQWMAERMHCLVAYFGLMGTDRTVLLHRWEWPPRQSLMEVQGAIMLVWKCGQQEQMQMLEGAQGAPPLPGGIAPPLE